MTLEKYKNDKQDFIFRQKRFEWNCPGKGTKKRKQT